jgi:hypothetical protein
MELPVGKRLREKLRREEAPPLIRERGSRIGALEEHKQPSVYAKAARSNAYQPFAR